MWRHSQSASILLKTQVLLRFSLNSEKKKFKILYNKTGCTFLTRLQMLNTFCKTPMEVTVTNLTSYEKKENVWYLKTFKELFLRAKS